MDIIYIVISILLGCIFGYFISKHFIKIKVAEINKDIEIEEIVLKNKRDSLISEIDFQTKKLNEIIDNQNNFSSSLNQENEEKKRLLEEQFKQKLKDIAEEFNNYQIEIQQQKNILEQELNSIKSLRDAAIQASLKEQEIKEKEDFYRVKLLPAEQSDVDLLDSIKMKLMKPEILSKYIWSSYYQQKVNTMCGQVLGKEIICGIYKITNQETNQSYIGQSVDISKRWKDHIKSALGASGSVSNKLYSSMQKYGINKFTFELLEECSRENLDSKEKYWIEIYQSNISGLNVVKGNN